MKKEEVMSDSEIVAMYKGAKYKEEQIKILKDLTLKSEKEICEILLAAGVLEAPERQAKNNKKLKWTTEKTEELIKLYKKGASREEMAKRLGFNKKAITNKIYELRKFKVIDQTKEKKQNEAADYTADVPVIKTADASERIKRNVQKVQSLCKMSRDYYSGISYLSDIFGICIDLLDEICPQEVCYD